MAPRRGDNGTKGGGKKGGSRPAQVDQFTFKVLCPDRLAASIVGKSGAQIGFIQETSHARLTFSNRGVYYPNSRLRVLVISAEQPDSLMTALDMVLEQVCVMGDEERSALEESGKAPSSDCEFIREDGADGSQRYYVNCAVTTSAAAVAAGSSTLPEETGASFFDGVESFDNHKLVGISGNRDQLISALEGLSDLVQADCEQQWFKGWAEQREFLGKRGGGSKSQVAEASSRGGKVTSSPCTIFVGGLSQSTQEATLLEHFSSYGEVVSADVKMDKCSGRSKGFGFVTFAEEFMVDECVADTHEQVIDDKRVEVKRYGSGEAGDRLADDRSGPHSAGLAIASHLSDLKGALGHRESSAERHRKGGGRDRSRSRGRRPSLVPGGRGSPQLPSGNHAGSGRGSRESKELDQAPMRSRAEADDKIRWLCELAGSMPPEYLNLDYQIECRLRDDVGGAAFGALFGRKGANIREVEQATQAGIDVSKKEETDEEGFRTVTIVGPMLSGYAAHLRLMKTWNDAVKRERQLPEEDNGGDPSIDDLKRQVELLKEMVEKKERAVRR